MPRNPKFKWRDGQPVVRVELSPEDLAAILCATRDLTERSQFTGVEVPGLAEAHQRLVDTYEYVTGNKGDPQVIPDWTRQIPQ
jgi:hypothetical protein